MGKVWGSFIAALLVVGLVAIAPPADARLIRTANAAEYSINWSGYAVPAGEGQKITEVVGAWRVPAIKNLPPGLSSSWIGIGGYSTSDLIQVGTASSGQIEGNYAWYEMLPDYAIPITSGCAGDDECTVSRGDVMVGRVTLVAGNTWQMFLTNFGKGSTPRWSWAMTTNYNSTLSSAEWIFEAPQVGLAGVSDVVGGVQTTPANAPNARFLPGASYKVNGQTRPLAGSGAARIIMVEQGTGFAGYFFGAPGLAYRTATPSLLAPDGHFQVCAYKRTCPNY